MAVWNFVRHYFISTFVSTIMLWGSTAVAANDGFLVDVILGEPITMDILMDDLESVDIVYVGEIHTVSEHHELQEDILRGLADMGGKPALAMEMFARHQQETVDRWLAGTDGVDDLIRSLGAEHWTNLLDYSRVLLFAREARIPVLCINARDALVRKVARKGLESLSEAERAEIPADLEDVNPKYDRLLRMRLMVHKGFGKGMLDRIVLAQVLRDATMAFHINRFMESNRGEHGKMMVIAGTGHMNYGFGIPDRTRRLNNRPYRIVVPSESGRLVLSEAEKRHARPIVVSHKDLRFIEKPIGDYLYILPLKEEEPDSEPPDDSVNTARR